MVAFSKFTMTSIRQTNQYQIHHRSTPCSIILTVMQRHHFIRTHPSRCRSSLSAPHSQTRTHQILEWTSQHPIFLSNYINLSARMLSSPSPHLNHYHSYTTMAVILPLYPMLPARITAPHPLSPHNFIHTQHQAGQDHTASTTLDHLPYRFPLQ
jgi:hypothetical protein